MIVGRRRTGRVGLDRIPVFGLKSNLMRVKNFTIVVNPTGGTGRALAVLEEVKPVFAAAKAELHVQVTTHAGHAAALAKTIESNGCDGFCLIGGDGTLHEVVSGLMARATPATVPLGIIPAGTGNSFMQHFNCLDPVDAARRIVAGNTQPLDAARVRMGSQVAYCVNVLSWGALVDINRTAEKLRVLGPPRYAAAAITQMLRPRRRRARLVLDGRAFEDKFLFAAACNTQFTGKGMRLAPKADSGDGKLDVVLVRCATRLQMLKMFKRVFDGSHMSLPCVESHQVHSFRIESEGVDGLNLD
jgi:YegS/Rv2252/BmrU family lipid kinase